LNISMVAASDAGVYSVAVTDSNGSITSSIATLAIPPSSGSFNATVGTFFNNNVVVSLPTGNTADVNDYFILASGALTSPFLSNGQSTTNALPPGLTFVASWVNGASALTGVIYGTPTLAGSFPITVSVVRPGYAVLSQNLIITISNTTVPSGGGSNPATGVITNQPVGIVAVAGSTTNFTVLAGGTAPLAYQWYFNTNTILLNATNALLNLANLRVSQAGSYSVVITNAGGAITSSAALLTVTLPASPAIGSPAVGNGKFQFTFDPVVGLTNSVLANGAMSGGSWTALTNVPPPITTNAITVTDPMTGTNRFYRIQIIP